MEFYLVDVGHREEAARDGLLNGSAVQGPKTTPEFLNPVCKCPPESHTVCQFRGESKTTLRFLSLLFALLKSKTNAFFEWVTTHVSGSLSQTPRRYAIKIFPSSKTGGMKYISTCPVCLLIDWPCLPSHILQANDLSIIHSLLIEGLTNLRNVNMSCLMKHTHKNFIMASWTQQ